MNKKCKIELYNDHFENAKRYGIPHAQLIIADIPYNLGNNAYASNPSWYIDGDNKNGESDYENGFYPEKDHILIESTQPLKELGDTTECLLHHTLKQITGK